MPSVTPFLWFDNNAQEAMHFYASVFPHSKIISESPMSVEFELEGQRIMGMNAGPQFKFNEAISMFVSCETQEEIDNYWTKLMAGGGSPSRCGWLKDRYGLSWQIVPKKLGQLLRGPDAAGSKRALDAMLKMNKLDIGELERAYAAGA